uniref:ATPase family AAA domain-containing protein 2 n=1 Tax=Sphaeramia orbicularis TaxID=375764 RepID=A0A673A0J8_9TELE
MHSANSSSENTPAWFIKFIKYSCTVYKVYTVKGNILAPDSVKSIQFIVLWDERPSTFDWICVCLQEIYETPERGKSINRQTTSRLRMKQNLPDEVEESSTPKRSRFDLQREEEEEDQSVRRSSRITRYKLDSRKQSVLYDRLITNTAEAVLQKMDDMQKMRRRLRSRDTKEEVKNPTEHTCTMTQQQYEEDEQDEEEEEGDGEDEDDEEEEDEEEDDAEDEEEENQRRYDFRQRKTVDRYQAPQEGGSNGVLTWFLHCSNMVPTAPFNQMNYCWCVSCRCLPMNLVKEDLLGIHKDRMKIGASLADVDPMHIDRTVRFDSIGGLSRHISALKEMVVFPLLYPEVFERFKIQPPRGCLFYGPPGTGKTLVARALANECSQGERKVSFFMRKGADCLSKWVGESERQLRLLFDQVNPDVQSMVASIVSTLLALMDGLDSRGEVVVIGATNRLDSIDPALRRPGRFDREFLFGLPDREARKDILKIHTRQWTPPPSDAFLEELSDKCVGYCGADIKAVCSEAALCALRRRYPQIYSSSQKLVLDVNSIAISNRDFMAAMSKMVPAAQRAVVSPAKALIPVVRPLLSAALQDILQTVQKVFPHAEQGLKRKREPDAPVSLSEDELMFSEDEDTDVCSSGQTSQSQLRKSAATNIPMSYRPRLLLQGRPGSGQSSHLAPAVLHALEKFTVYTLDMAVLFGVSATTPEETCAQVFVEAKRTSPSVLYVPHIGQWWETVGPALRATFLSLLSSIPAFAPILLLATCNLHYEQLSVEVQELFRVEYGEVFHVPIPTSRERRNFFEDLILNQTTKAPASKKKAVLHAVEVLPVAPPRPPRQLTKDEIQRLEEQEEDTLRELRLFLRDVTNRLSQDKRFKAFTKPVDLEEVPDYAEVIKKPMDLSTVLSNIDLHRYGTVKEFLQDVDLIWQNALEYNPDRDPSDRQIRHRACALKDTVHAIIRHELDEDFEKICEEIKASRSRRGCSTGQFAPSYYHVLPKPAETKTSESTPQRDTTGTMTVAPVATTTVTTPKTSGQKKKRRKSRWSSGIITKRKTTSCPHVSRDDAHSEDEDDGDDEEEADKGPEAEQGEVTGGEGEVTGGEGEGMGGEGEATGREGEAMVCDDAEPEGQQRKEVTKETGNHQNEDKGQTPEGHQMELMDLLERLVSQTEGYELHQLEKLYALLCQSIYRHRREYDKTPLIQELEQEVTDFC